MTMSYTHPLRIFRAGPYQRRVGKLLNDVEWLRAEAEIVAYPEAWPVIAGTGGARKARVRRGARGKSGGARVVYFYRPRAAEIYLIMIYAKSDQKELTNAQKKEIRQIIATIDRQL